MKKKFEAIFFGRGFHREFHSRIKRRWKKIFGKKEDGD
jgi:hypothetical protein